ncbi:MAG: CBS domain-containing protein, partial [Thermoguttaceae bacterium]
LELLLEQADSYLRIAKESGRNRCIGSADAVATSLSGGQGLSALFGGATVRDAMQPLPLVLKNGESVATSVARMLSNSMELAAVVCEEGCFKGVVSSVNLMSLIGVFPKWQGVVEPHILPNSVSYQADASVRVLFDFFSRATLPCVFVLDDQKPVGIVTCNGLMTWLRERWATMSGCRDIVVPTHLLKADLP